MRICLAILLLFLGLVVKAQRSYYSQHSYAVPESSPAMIATDTYANATLLYKNQKLTGVNHLISTLLFAKYPIVNHKNKRLTLGITFTENKIKGAGKLTEQLFSSTLAYGFNYTKYKGVSFAMDFGMVTKKINLNDIQTGSMWTIENGFNPELSSGENLEVEKLIYPQLNASIYWFVNDRNKDTKSYVGLSVFQLNKTRDSFYNKDKQVNNIYFSALGGLRLYDKNKVALTPKFIITGTSSGFYIEGGMDLNYSLAQYKNNVSRKENSFNLEFNYQVNKGAQFGFQFLQPQYIAGMAYHFDISNKAKNNVFNNAVEVLFVIRNPVDISPQKKRSSRTYKNKKSKKNKKNTPKDKKSITPEKNGITPTEKLIEPDSAQTQNTGIKDSINAIESNSPIIQDVISDSTSTEKWEASVLLGNVYSLQFDYNSTEINETSYQKLEQLAALLKTYSNTRIILIGHTDNIGTLVNNKIFSIKRAKSAAKVLLDMGVSSSKIITQGKGELEPIDTNSTEKGRSNNRRIEFYLINY